MAPPAEDPLQPLLERGLAEIGLPADAAQRDRLAGLCERVARWGKQINLTGFREPAGIARRLVLDAAALLQQLPLPQPGDPGAPCSIADLGSGAGFPGLPIAILRPEISVLLVEARERRHHFQRAAIRELGLPNACALRGRIEALDPEPCRVVLAQAIGPRGEVLAAMAPWCEPGGWRVIPGSAGTPAPAVAPGFELVERSYRVPLEGPERVVWLVRQR